MLDRQAQSISREGMTDARITAFDSQAMLLAASHAFSLGALQHALTNRKEAVLLGAGGSTPAPLYALLSNAPINWAKVTIGLTDERWVPLSHAASNGAMMKRKLLQNAAAKARFVSMVSDAEKLGARPSADEMTALETAYAPLVENCDLMILGMGPDAHTLSWFPDARGLRKALSPKGKSVLAAIKAIPSSVTGDQTSRISLTYSAVAKAKRVLLLMTGEEKRRVFEMAGPQTPLHHMINAAEDRLTTYWAP